MATTSLESTILSAINLGFAKGPAIAECIGFPVNDRVVYDALQKLRKHGMIEYRMGHGWSVVE